jgi:NAD(P)-dependent dehydrogenase (short-subunit alcohol dehydrogenase family)
MSIDLSGRIIIITGAGSGIGAATALACAKAGMQVVMSDRHGARLEETARQIGPSGNLLKCVVGDVADPGHSKSLLDAALKLEADSQSSRDRKPAGLYAVLANAGIAIEAPMSNMTMAQLRRIFEINFFAGVDLLQQAARQFIAKSRPGRLIMCSSCLGRMGLPFYGAYCATKAAQLMVCKAMNLELRPRRICVSSVHPIATRTRMHETAAEESGLPNGAVQMFGKTPKMFIQDPERVAEAVVKALRKNNPPPEIWTSHIVRVAAGVMTMFPRFNDWVMRDEVRRRNTDPSSLSPRETGRG